MSRRAPRPDSEAARTRMRRAKLDNKILELMREHGRAMFSAEIARAIGEPVAEVIGRLNSMHRIGILRHGYLGRDARGGRVITYQATDARTQAAPRDWMSRWTPLQPPKPTVIPVRRGGRIASAPVNEPAVPFGYTQEA